MLFWNCIYLLTRGEKNINIYHFYDETSYRHIYSRDVSVIRFFSTDDPSTPKNKNNKKRRTLWNVSTYVLKKKKTKQNKTVSTITCVTQ